MRMETKDESEEETVFELDQGGLESLEKKVASYFLITEWNEVLCLFIVSHDHSEMMPD